MGGERGNNKWGCKLLDDMVLVKIPVSFTQCGVGLVGPALMWSRTDIEKGLTISRNET